MHQVVHARHHRRLKLSPSDPYTPRNIFLHCKNIDNLIKVGNTALWLSVMYYFGTFHQHLGLTFQVITSTSEVIISLNKAMTWLCACMYVCICVCASIHTLHSCVNVCGGSSCLCKSTLFLTKLCKNIPLSSMRGSKILWFACVAPEHVF